MPLEFVKQQPPEAVMILEKAVAPDSSAQHFIAKFAAKNGAAALTTKLAAEEPGGMKSAADVRQYSHAHEIYFMRLDDLAQGAGLDKARSLGWRYLKTDDPQSTISVEAYTRPVGNRPGFAQVTSGPYCQSTLSAITTAENNPEVQGSPYEPRLLHVPALSLLALWLQKKTANLGEQDLFLPLVPIPSFLVEKIYSTGEFFEILHRVAQARLLEIQPGAVPRQQKKAKKNQKQRNKN